MPVSGNEIRAPLALLPEHHWAGVAGSLAGPPGWDSFGAQVAGATRRHAVDLLTTCSTATRNGLRQPAAQHPASSRSGLSAGAVVITLGIEPG